MDSTDHSARLSVVSNAVLDGSEPTAVMYDGEGFFIFADDIDMDEFIDFLEEGDTGNFGVWTPRVKPVCLHCVIDLHPGLLEKLHVAQQEGAWSKNDYLVIDNDTDHESMPYD